MPVMILDVPTSAWNQVVMQSLLFGLDIYPDHHNEEFTIVEISGSLDKLNESLKRIKARCSEKVELLKIMEQVTIS